VPQNFLYTVELVSSPPLFLDGVRLSPLGTSATVGLLYQPRMIDDDYGAVGGMRRKSAPVPLRPPHPT
jgi:hypothetical protein